jgi:hypothetical protein
MMTSSSVHVLFIDDGGYLASVAKAPSDGGQWNQATNAARSPRLAFVFNAFAFFSLDSVCE